MESLRATFNCSFDALPAIGQFVLDTLIRDKADLAGRSIKYKTATFLDNYKLSLQAVNVLVNPAAFTARHKKLTEQIDTDAKAIRPQLNNLDIRLADAADLPDTGAQLSINPVDFGLKAVRAAITAQDAEAIIRTGKDVLDNLTANADALTLVEYPATERTELERLLGALAENNATQNTLISARDANVQANLQTLNGFYDTYLSRALADGKKAYKEEDDAKTRDYTFARLKARVAAQRPAARKPKAPKP